MPKAKKKKNAFGSIECRLAIEDLIEALMLKKCNFKKFYKKKYLKYVVSVNG